MLAGDYKRRTQSATTSAGVSSGFGSSPVHVTGDGNPHEVLQAGGVLCELIPSDTSSAGINVWFQDSNGDKQDIVTVGKYVARSYKFNFYCPWPLYVSSDVDLTCTVHAPAKGNTQD